MVNIEKFTSVIFDLDGTLIDSVADVHAAINYALNTFDYPSLTLEQVYPLIGKGARHLIAGALNLAAASTISLELIEKCYDVYIQRYRSHPCDHIKVYDGVYDLLNYAIEKNIRLGICTNKPGVMARLILSTLNMDHYFQSIVCGDEIDYPKPDSRHISYVMKELNVEKNQVMMVGDSEYDIKPANDLAVFSVLLHTKTALKKCSPNVFFETFIEFKQYMMD